MKEGKMSADKRKKYEKWKREENEEGKIILYKKKGEKWKPLQGLKKMRGKEK